MERKRFCEIIVVFFVLFTFVAVPLNVSAAEKKSITQKMLLGGRVGDPWFVLSQALAYFVNKQSDWLRLDVVATPGADAGNEMAMKDPDKYIFLSSDVAMRVLPKSERFSYYDKMRIIGLCNVTSWVWVSYDKKINTAQDLVGKKILIGRPGGLRVIVEKEILKEMGVLDKVKIVHGGYGGGRNALKDGLVDVTVMIYDYILPAGFRKGAFIEDMQTRKPIYYPNIMPKELQLKLGLLPVRLYPGALDRKTQPKELWATIYAIFFAADERMDEAIVYEVTRILNENADKFTGWHAHGASLTKEFIPTYSKGPEWVHRGALKYYEEKGIKLNPVIDLLP